MAATANNPDLSAAGLKAKLQWLIPLVRPYAKLIGTVILASISIQLCGLAIPLSLQIIFDKVIPYSSVSTLYVLMVAVISVTLVQALLQYLRWYALSYISSGFDAQLGNRVYQHLLKLPVAYFDQMAAGQIVARMNEIGAIRRFLLDQGAAALVDTLFVFIYLIILVGYSPVLSLLVFAALLAHAVSVMIIRPHMRTRSNLAFDAGAAKQELLVESLNGMLTLKSAGAESSLLVKWKRRLGAHARSVYRMGTLSAVSQPLAQHIGTFTTAAILFFGTKATIAGEITIGELLAFNMIAGLVQAPIFRIVPLWQDLQDMLVSLERLGEIMLTPEEQTHALVDVPTIHGAISMRDVAFRYLESSANVLHDVNLEIPASQVVGVVGASGSGKSTLVKLIQRLYVPQNGQLLIDGVDITNIDPRCIRKHVAIVLQESTLFCGTVHENIALSNPALTRDEVCRAAALAGAEDFISNMPDGYETLLDHRGSNLSHGQRQRLGIARALAQNPRILIFDEATSAVDYETEMKIQRNLRDIAAGRTMIIISHRLPILQQCDRIVVMRSGRIIEDDTHAALLRRDNGHYKHMWSLHARGAA